MSIDADVQGATLDQLVEWAAALVVPGQRRILGLTGAPGAGKSTVAEQLVTALGPEAAVLVPMDGYHLANEVLIDSRPAGPEGRARHVRRRRVCAVARHAAGPARRRPGRVRAAVPPRDRRVDRVVHPGPAHHAAGGHRGQLPAPGVRTRGRTRGPASTRCGSWPPTPTFGTRRLVRRHEAYGKSPQDAQRWALGSDERNAQLIESTAGRADRIVRLP